MRILALALLFLVALAGARPTVRVRQPPAEEAGWGGVVRAQRARRRVAPMAGTGRAAERAAPPCAPRLASRGTFRQQKRGCICGRVGGQGLTKKKDTPPALFFWAHPLSTSQKPSPPQPDAVPAPAADMSDLDTSNMASSLCKGARPSPDQHCCTSPGGNTWRWAKATASLVCT